MRIVTEIAIKTKLAQCFQAQGHTPAHTLLWRPCKIIATKGFVEKAMGSVGVELPSL